MQVNGPDQVMGFRDEAVYHQTIARMFRWDFMEVFSRVHPVVPALLFLPVVAWAGLLAWQSLGLWSAGVALFGVLIWTFIEYVMHRFVFHIKPNGLVSRTIYVYLHGVHHHYPDDHYRLVMVPIVSIPLAFAFHALFGLLFPAAWVPAVYAGFVFGYLGYDYSHYFTHHGRAPRGALLQPIARVMKIQRRRHMRHHFADHERGFGVSTGLWDTIFRTVDLKS